RGHGRGPGRRGRGGGGDHRSLHGRRAARRRCGHGPGRAGPVRLLAQGWLAWGRQRAGCHVLLHAELRSAVPTGRVKWYDADKGYGFLTSDEGGDVFVPKGALPAGITDLKGGQRVEFGVVKSRRGTQA